MSKILQDKMFTLEDMIARFEQRVSEVLDEPTTQPVDEILLELETMAKVTDTLAREIICALGEILPAEKTEG